MTVKLSSDGKALVGSDTWLPIDKNAPPPVGVKMQLINKPSGSAQTASYDGNPFWTHYAGLPAFSEKS